MSAGRHMRRSELAGWRTRSLFPAPRVKSHCHQRFLPILKLRGLPYYSTKQQVLAWFGDMAPSIHKLILIPELEPLNSGFALAIMTSADAAMRVWREYHKVAITNKRFVEVFTLVPPNCPLVKRGAPQVSSNNFIGDCGVCDFCGNALGLHGDGGLGSLACSRLRSLIETGKLSPSAQGLMPCAFLEIPALLYQDNIDRQELQAFKPLPRNESGVYKLADLEGTIGEHISAPSENNSNAIDIDQAEFFDVSSVAGYDIRALLCELINILAPLEEANSSPSYSGMKVRYVMRIVDIGNRLSTRARAYLFIVEQKLQGILERFPEIFSICRISGVLWVSICGHHAEAISLVNGAQFDLSLRRKKRLPRKVAGSIRSSPTSGSRTPTTPGTTNSPSCGQPLLGLGDNETNLLSAPSSVYGFDQTPNLLIPPHAECCPLETAGFDEETNLLFDFESHKDSLSRETAISNIENNQFISETGSGGTFMWGDEDELPLTTPSDLSRHYSALTGGNSPTNSPFSRVSLERNLSAFAAPISRTLTPSSSPFNLSEKRRMSYNRRCDQDITSPSTATSAPLSLVRSITEDPNVIPQTDNFADHFSYHLMGEHLDGLLQLYRSVTSPTPPDWESVPDCAASNVRSGGHLLAELPKTFVLATESRSSYSHEG